jgi:hypothetical protein
VQYIQGKKPASSVWCWCSCRRACCRGQASRSRKRSA